MLVFAIIALFLTNSVQHYDLLSLEVKLNEMDFYI